MYEPITLKTYAWDPQRLLLWDSLVSVCTMYIMIEMGLTAFIDETDVVITTTMYWLDVFALSVFIAAFFIQFKRGYYDKGKLILDRQRVVKHYHCWRLALDIIVIVLIGLTLIPQVRLNPLRFIILWRFYYLYMTDQSYFRLYHTKKGWYVFYTFCKMLIIFYLFCHYTGCSYYWIDYYLHKTSFYGGNEYTELWTYYQYLWSPILAQVWYMQYMYTMYYSVETFTTIAYGDNTPKNPIETIFVMFFLIASAVMLSYIIEQIIMLFYPFLKNRFMYLRKLKAMRSYLYLKNVDEDLSDRLMCFYEYLWNEQRLIKNSELQVIMGKLPQVLRSQLCQQLFIRYFRSIDFLAYLPSNLYDFLIDMINERIVLPGQRIFEPYQKDEGALYLLAQKQACYFYKYDRHSKKELDIESKTLTAFGEYEFFTGMPRRNGMRILRQDVMYELPRKKFIAMLKENNESVYQQFHMRKHSLLYDTKYPIVGTCECCKSKLHNAVYCDTLHFKPNLIEIIYKSNTTLQYRSKHRRRSPKNRRIFALNGTVHHQPLKSFKVSIKQAVERMEQLTTYQFQHAEWLLFEDNRFEAYCQYKGYCPEHNISSIILSKNS